MWNLPEHSYEEIRNAVVDVLLKKDPNVNQFSLVLDRTARELVQRHGGAPSLATGLAYPGAQAQLHPNDRTLLLEVFWDLFRQGFITLGLDDANAGWPWFRLSRFGQQLKEQTPYRFHDTSSYIAMIKSAAADLSSDAELYLEEAVAAFYADCLLAAIVMLGVAAEAEFLRLVDVAAASANYKASFEPIKKLKFVREKITAFQKALAPHLKTLPAECREDLDTNLLGIQSVLRIARNDAGHPSGTPPPAREQVYIHLQLFAPFARQLMRLRGALS
jgi:hypothetical protein